MTLEKDNEVNIKGIRKLAKEKKPFKAMKRKKRQ